MPNQSENLISSLVNALEDDSDQGHFDIDKHPRFKKMLESRASKVRYMSVDELVQRLQQEPHFPVVDVRELQEGLVDGCIINSETISRGVIEQIFESISPDVSLPFVVYCNEGYRSTLVAYSLQEMGYENVFCLTGGFAAWLEAELPIEEPSFDLDEDEDGDEDEDDDDFDDESEDEDDDDEGGCCGGGKGHHHH